MAMPIAAQPIFESIAVIGYTHRPVEGVKNMHSTWEVPNIPMLSLHTFAHDVLSASLPHFRTISAFKMLAAKPTMLIKVYEALPCLQGISVKGTAI